MSGVALITGGAKRIGAEIAKNLAQNGYNIVISYNDSSDAAQNLIQEISKKYNVKCSTFHCNLLDLDATKKLAEFTRNFATQNNSSWNLLINNASIFNKSKFLANEVSSNLGDFNIHFFSPLILSQFLAKNCQQGNIINITDANITRHKTNYFYYLLSKKFLAETTKILATELAPNIRVNAVAPGLILENLSEDKSCEEWILAAKKTPLHNQKGSPQDIVAAINFLLTNPFITGQTLFVDGGQNLIN